LPVSDDSRDGSNRPPSTNAAFASHPEPEQIAAWVDEPDLLAPEERRVLEAHLARCPACQQVAADLRSIVAALATLGDVDPPHSFALPQSERARTAPQPILMAETRAWRERQLRATRWATAIAAILLVLVLGVDLVTGSDGSNESASNAATMQMKSAPMSAAGAQVEDSTGGSTAGGAAEGRTTGDDASTAGEESTSTEESAQTFGFGAAATPASGSSAESVPAPEAATGDAAGAVVETPEVNTLTAAQDSSRQVAAQTSERSSDRLRLIEAGLAMLIVWLLIAMIAIPHIRRQSGNPH
jgi:hypothetical protein